MTLEGSMENSNGSIVDYSSEIETLKKAKQPMDSGYSSMEEDADCKVEIVESVYAVSERSEDDWIKPKIERKLTIQTPDKKHICGRISVAGISSPGRNHLSDGGASSSDASPGASSPSRSCTQCGATKTPLWRNGPSGPKSLCNACGIRYKKVGGSRRTTATDPHESSSHHSGKSSSKSPKRKAELDSGPSTHRRSKQQSREKREAEDSNNNNNNGTSSTSRGPNHQQPQPQPQPQQQPQQQSPGITSNIPRRVCTRRTLPAFNTQKWGSRSARFSSSGFRKSQSKDEEEGAALLMALACGLVNA